MMHAGFSRDEMYDLMTEVGLQGEQVQLMIDRVAAEFHGTEMRPRPSRIANEVERVFQEAIEELKHEMFSRANSFALQQEIIKTELEKMKQGFTNLQAIIQPRKFRGKKTSNKPH